MSQLHCSTFFMQVVLLLPSCNCKMKIYAQNNTPSSVIKDFPIRLKGNLREEDNLSTRDKWHVPNVSFVWRFYCKFQCGSGIFVHQVKSIGFIVKLQKLLE